MRTYILQEDTPWGKKGETLGESKNGRTLVGDIWYKGTVSEETRFILSKLGVLQEVHKAEHPPFKTTD